MCIHATCSVNTPPWQLKGEYTLDRSLGIWLHTKRHIQYGMYQTQNGIIVHGGDGDLTVCLPTPLKGQYHSNHTCPYVPSLSHPIHAQLLPNGVWTHRKFQLRIAPAQIAPCANVLHDSFQQISTNIDVVSDASVHTRLQKLLLRGSLQSLPQINAKQLSETKDITTPHCT